VVVTAKVLSLTALKLVLWFTIWTNVQFII